MIHSFLLDLSHIITLVPKIEFLTETTWHLFEGFLVPKVFNNILQGQYNHIETNCKCLREFDISSDCSF